MDKSKVRIPERFADHPIFNELICGTNFGFMNGANCTEKEYQPTVNSYDDDAPVNEYGYMTPKYFKFKEVLESFGSVSDIEVSQPETVAYPSVKLNECADLFDNLSVLSEKHTMTNPLPMEKLGQGYGYTLYETFIRGPREEDYFMLTVHDRAYVYVNDEFKCVLYRNDKKKKLKLGIPAEGIKLSILVENMGRINYGFNLFDKKPPLIREFRDKTEGRITTASVTAACMLAVTAACWVVKCAASGFGALDIVSVLLLAVGSALAGYMFAKRKAFATEERDNPNAESVED